MGSGPEGMMTVTKEEGATGSMKPAHRALEQAGRASEPAGRASEPAGRILEPVGRSRREGGTEVIHPYGAAA